MAKVKLYAPAGATSCSVDGVVFEVVDGTVEVPEEHAETLSSHGYATSFEKAKAPEAVTAEAFAEMAQKLTVAKQDAAELLGVVDAARSERDAALVKVSEMEKQLAEAKKKRG